MKKIITFILILSLVSLQGGNVMAEVTTNYGLKKPLSTEYYTVEDQNSNMDIIDAELKRQDDARAAHEAEKAKDDIHGLAFKGVLVQLNALQSIPNDTETAVSWSAMKWDSLGMWNVAEPEKIKIPVNIKKIRIIANLRWSGVNDNIVNVAIRRYDAATSTLKVISSTMPCITQKGIDGNILNLYSGVVDLEQITFTIGTDSLVLVVRQTSGGSLNLSNYNRETWLRVEVVE
jgi:hypothetical protein